MEVDSDSGSGLHDPVYHRIIYFLDFCRFSSLQSRSVHWGGSLATSSTQCSLEFYIDHGRDYGKADHDVLLFFPVQIFISHIGEPGIFLSQ